MSWGSSPAARETDDAYEHETSRLLAVTEVWLAAWVSGCRGDRKDALSEVTAVPQEASPAEDPL